MLETFHPLVRSWFERRFDGPTEPQVRAWPAIAAGEDVLVSAPTGSGKTLAAFLSALDGLLRAGLAGALPDATRVVYVSPLRALSNDVERNLLGPLGELCEAARRAGHEPPALRVAVRTGDTPGSRREAILRRPPHVLVTTPESLYLLLTAERGRGLLRTVETVIVDEIHALAKDKRGAHLALSLERLEALVQESTTRASTGSARAGVDAAGPRRRPQRIGLSATVEPLDELARFLVGAGRVGEDGAPRCTRIELDRLRRLDLGIEIPDDPLSSVASRELVGMIHDRLAALIRERRSTIVFVNTRRAAERVAHALEERLGAEVVAAHHGSLARERRLDAEERLKAGRLKAIVATSSLELGIDVGAVELVAQLGSPGALAAALQRVGRSGHVHGATPVGRFFPATRDELVECAAAVRGLRRGRLEPTLVPDAPLDVLAQQLAAEAAARDVGTDELFALVRRAWPYRALSREAFDDVVELLAEGVAPRAGRSTALLHRDAVNGRLRGRRGARYAALTGAGAIPDTAQYAVVLEPEGAIVGQVDEDFAVESMGGDVFLLGNHSWRVLRVEATAVRVEDAHGQPPSVPFWNGEAPGRSAALSDEVSALREALEPRLAAVESSCFDKLSTSGEQTARPEREEAGSACRRGEGEARAIREGRADAIRWVMEECALSEPGARQVVEYLGAGRAALGALPTRRTWIAERFFDEAGGMQLVIHAPLGARTNRALGLALRKRFCRTFDFELQAAATDEGVLLSLGPQHSFPLETIFSFVTEGTVDEVLRQAVLQAPMFGVRWRWAATRALAIPRVWKGKRMPPALSRMRSDDLLAAVFPAQVACQDNAPPGPIEVPDHPLVEEALRDCLVEAMDAPRLRALLGEVARGEVRLLAVDTREPSPLAHELLAGKPWSYLDDAPLEERRARMVAVRRVLPEDAAQLARLDPAAVAEVSAEVWPDVRDADELHDALLELGVVPEGVGEGAGWSPWLEELVAAGRAVRLRAGGRTYWVAAERVGLALAAPLPGVRSLSPERAPLAVERVPADAAEAAARIARGWVPHLGPLTAASLGERLGLAEDDAAAALAALEAEGQVLRGRFLDDAVTIAPASPSPRRRAEPASSGPHFCERTVLARIHRMTLARLRREIEPVSTADFVRFLLRWQHLSPGTLLHGPHGLAEVVGQLQGFHAAAGAWEAELLARRIAGYAPAELDGLCLSGEVAWGRLGGRALEGELRRAAPTRAAPVTLALREDLPWLLAAAEGAAAGEPSTGSPRAPGGETAADAMAEPGAGMSAAASASPVARELLAVLRARGASFVSELAAATRRTPRDVEEGLWTLVAAGLATCDGFAGLRAITSGKRRGGAAGGGRWTLLHPAEPADASAEAPTEPGAGRPGPIEDGPPLLERLAQQYLRRYGVVFRDLLAREDAPPWRELVRVYRTLEARGSLRGGRFVAGRSGEQFALPEAVDALRAVRRAPRSGTERVEISAADPLNLVGILLPGARVPAGLGGRIVYVDGVPVNGPEASGLEPPALPTTAGSTAAWGPRPEA